MIIVLVIGLWTFLRAVLFGAATIALEHVALRHQLAVLHRSGRRPRLSRWDRFLWMWLSRAWAGWRSSLVIVQPATVLAWHRRGFQLYWRWKSRPNPVGRPKLDAEIRDLIRRMAKENPTWGRRRIRAELALLGYEVAELTVAKYMHRMSPRPSPTWRAFLATHARDIVAVDFFLVPTLTFRLLFVFVVLRHDRRELLHLNVTDHPSAVWTAQQIIEAFPEETAPRYLLRDRDAIYGDEFARRVEGIGIREVLTAPRAPCRTPRPGPGRGWRGTCARSVTGVAALRHQRGNGSLGHLDAELPEFAMDSRGAPQGIHRRHVSDEGGDLRVDRRTAHPRAAGEPRPVLTEATALPPQDQPAQTLASPPTRGDPSCAIWAEAPIGWTRRAATQGEVLQGELAVAAAEEREESNQVEHEGDHQARILSGSELIDQPLAHRMEFWRRTGCRPRRGYSIRSPRGSASPKTRRCSSSRSCPP